MRIPMRLKGWCWLSFILVALPLIGCSSSSQESGEYKPGELVVEFNPGVSQEQVASVAQEVKAEVRYRIDGTDLYLFTFANDTQAQAAIDILKQKEIIKSVFRNILFSIPEPLPERPEKK
jgi:ABC-type phosphate/phosphonate transport system substrate-binding protein